jgi:hypothetical protein
LLVQRTLEEILKFRVEDYAHFYEDNYLSVLRGLENDLKEKPYIQVQNEKICAFRDGSDFTKHQLLAAIASVQFDDLVTFQKAWLKTLRFETLV